VTELDTLPGIGPALAQRIIDYRTQNGDFKTIEDLKKVRGIGEALFDQIKDLITVH
jgi:competence protein ComEA